jgi:hypothetical protein
MHDEYFQQIYHLWLFRRVKHTSQEERRCKLCGTFQECAVFVVDAKVNLRKNPLAPALIRCFFVC